MKQTIDFPEFLSVMTRKIKVKDTEKELFGIVGVLSRDETILSNVANHDRLAQEKIDAKAVLQRLIDALAQVSNAQLNRPKNWEQGQKKFDEKRTPLEKKFNQLHPDIELMFKD